MKLKNKIVALFLTVACAFGLAVANKNVTKVEAASETITFQTLGYANGAAISTIEATNFTLTFDKGTGSTVPAYYNTGYAARLYGGNTLKIEVLEGNVITSVEFTYSSTSNMPKSANAGAEDCSWASDYLSVTPNDASQNSVTIKKTDSSGHWRIKTLTVNYETSGSVTPETDEEKLEAAINDLVVTDTYKLQLTGSKGSTISWSSDSDAVVIDEEGYVTVNKGTEDIDVVLTATVKVGELSDTKAFDFTIVAAGANDPVVGQAYKMAINHVSEGKELFFTSTMRGYYYVTTDVLMDATDVSFEATFDGYYMVTTNASGVKKYMDMVISGTYYNPTLVNAPTTVWTYDAENNTMAANVAGSQYFMGARGTYTTYGGYAYSNITNSEYYPAYLVNPNEVSVEEQINALSTMAQFGIEYKVSTSISEEEGRDVVADSTVTTSTNFKADEDGSSLIFGENASLFRAYSKVNNHPTHVGLNKDGTIRLYGVSGKIGTELIIESDATINYVTLDVKSGTDYEVVVNEQVVTVDADGNYPVNGNAFSVRHSGATGTTQIQLNSITVNIGGAVEVTTYSNFENAKLRFAGFIPAELAQNVESAAIKLTMGGVEKKYDATIVEDADGNLSFAVVLNGIPADNYADEITGTAQVVVDGEVVELQSKTYSVNSIVEHYLENAASLGLNADDIAILTAFQNA